MDTPTESPTPSPSPALNEDMVTPGVVGFIVTFFIAVATVLLVIEDGARRLSSYPGQPFTSAQQAIADLDE